MRRPPIGYVFALASVACAAVAIVSFDHAVHATWRLTERQQLVFYVYDGRARIFWFRASDPDVMIVAYRNPPSIMATRRSDYPAGTPETSDVPLARRFGRRRDFWFTNIMNSPRVSAFTLQFNVDAPIPASDTKPAIPVQINYVRFPMWLPTTFFLGLPVLVVLTGPWRERRRQRRNQCQLCGYSLHGLQEPRCPECGSFA